MFVPIQEYPWGWRLASTASFKKVEDAKKWLKNHPDHDTIKIIHKSFLELFL
jgi:hypothetical protein